MKTSFYFVFWILIYPLLGLLHSPVVAQNSFVIALILAFMLSWVLNRLMPKTFAYARKLQAYPILSDVFEGNVEAFRKRVLRTTVVSIVTAVYFLLVTFLLLCMGDNDWFAFLIFGFFTFGYISRSVTMFKLYLGLKDNPTPEKCMEIATDTYRLDYAAYYEERMSMGATPGIPAPPRHFKMFQIFSIIFASLAALFGLFFIGMFIISLCGRVYGFGMIFVGTSLLYGTLALYFGLSDIISISRNMTLVKLLQRPIN